MRRSLKDNPTFGGNRRGSKGVVGAEPGIDLRSESGIALLVTLLITALLVVIVTELVFAVHMNTALSGAYRASQRASLVAEGGVRIAGEALGRYTANSSYTYLEGTFDDQLFVDGGILVNVKVSDEHSKVSLKTLLYNNGETNEENYDIYLRLLRNLGLDEDLGETLLDWIDGDENSRSRGAETGDYYSTLSSPYVSKDSPLWSLEELLLVKGYHIDTFMKLKELVTVYTDGKININTAPKEVIMALSGEISEDMAEAVISYRREVPFENTASIRKVDGFDTLGFELQGRIVVSSKLFRVSSKAVIEDHTREVEAVTSIKGGGGEGDILYWRER